MYNSVRYELLLSFYKWIYWELERLNYRDKNRVHEKGCFQVKSFYCAMLLIAPSWNVLRVASATQKWNEQTLEYNLVIVWEYWKYLSKLICNVHIKEKEICTEDSIQLKTAGGGSGQNKNNIKNNKTDWTKSLKEIKS